MGEHSIALKEWASTIRALLEGDQFILLRKGGIHEETRHFETRSDSFYLYPAYEHQRRELLKPEVRHYVDDSLRELESPGLLKGQTYLYAWAEVVDDIPITSEQELSRLYEFHMWTANFVEERLRWKSEDPLHVLLLRVYRLNRPLHVPALPEYGGCKSWIDIQELPRPDKDNLTPVIPLTEFAEKARVLRRALRL
ncbi:DUF1802 family protein [Paenibacillus physcomitrellae]|uniref:DUF1802 family protein n=1 Tax=Paenibacillus physcomitrellae TaxID=1619311 RepID=A0ABQ1GY73_9BACL|nr:DUF1802 family protein [Paenibacillus physcomitrellae]GGA52497.1 hypothetical protein GCM10010917_42140 [Paenibacillus physcomitrellae]